MTGEVMGGEVVVNVIASLTSTEMVSSMAKNTRFIDRNPFLLQRQQ
jgi:hypothetical protein